MRSGRSPRRQCSLVQAPTTDANVCRSMLPPDTMATIFPRTRPESAAATAQPAAPSAITWQRSATSLMRRPDLGQRHDDRTGQQPRQQRPHRRQHRSAAGAIDERGFCQPSNALARPFFSDVSNGAAVSGSAANSCTSGRRPRMAVATPASRPPPPSGADDDVDVGQVFEDFEPCRAVAGDESIVVKRMHEQPAHPIGAVLLDRAPAFVIGGADDRGAELFDCADLDRGRGVHHHHRTGHAGDARRERHALRGVAGADRPHAVGQRRARRLPDHVPGAADLERSDRLQRFELQKNLGVARERPRIAAGPAAPAASGRRDCK